MPIRSLIPACVLLLALPLSAASAQTPAKDTSPRVILVSGVGEVSGKPDRAQLSAGVLTQGPTAAAALAANNTAMNGVFAALKKIGIPDNKIQTSNFSVSPQYAPYRQDNPQPAKIVGYQVSNNVTVIVDDLSKTGPTLDALVQSGANQLGGEIGRAHV